MSQDDTLYDVAGLGNALVDSLVVVDDGRLDDIGFERGIMSLVDPDRWESLFHRFKGPEMEVHSGGSAANTILTLGFLGSRVVFRGQVADDDLGRLYAASISEACGGHSLNVLPGLRTGRCLSLVSRSDRERTMLTYLGAAIHLPDLGAFADQIRRSRVFHTTGYALLEGPIRQAALMGMEVAREAGVKVSVDVSDPWVVSMIRKDLWDWLERYAHVAFLNEEEASAMCEGLPAERAVHEVAKVVDIAVVKLGRRGSLIKADGVLTPIGIHPVQAVDTTGAGDSFAAGFLHGVCQDWSPVRAGRLAARVAARTVAQLGAVVRDPQILKAEIEACKERP